MAKNKVEELITYAQNKQGFTLAEKLTSASAKTVKNFEERWIRQTRESGGLSRDDLNDPAASPKQRAARVLANSWSGLETKVGGGFSLEKTDEWYFSFYVGKADKTFRLPYDLVAIKVCHQMIQYYT